MNNKKVNNILIACSLVCLTTASMAMSVKPYVGVLMGSSAQTLHYPAGNANVTYNTGFSYSLLGGVTFNPYLGVELGYDNLGEFNNNAFTFNHSNISADLKVMYPFKQTPFVIYGKAGFGQYTQKIKDAEAPYTSKTNSSWELALGGSYAVTKQIDINAQYKYIRAHNSQGESIDYETGYYAVGVNYLF